MGLEAKTKNYWIAPNAISIGLNALGNNNRIQGSVLSGSVISCYIESVKPESAGEEYAGNGDGLGLDNGRNPKRWPLAISPTYFNSNTPKYVYVAIPRKASLGTQAIVVFPSEKIDLYGRNNNDEQVGSMDYFYVWLQGIISAPTGEQMAREWTQRMVWGSLGTYEDIVDMSESDWFSYSGSTETVTFLKRIVMKAGSFFNNIFLGDEDHELTGVATAATDDEYIDSDTLVATPNFVKQHYLRKDADDTATGLIGFAKGLWVKASGLFGFSEDGDVVARSLKATGSSGGTIVDIDNATRKNLGLEVSESGIIGGIFRVGKAILTKTVQSLNFTGGDSMFGTGWQLTDNDGNGKSRLVVDNLFVRAKAVFNELEVRKFVAMGGNYIFSPAASIIEEVDYIGLDENDNEVVLGYEYVKVPWLLRLVPLSIAGKFLSRKKMVRSSVEDIDFSEVVKFRCWLRSDDGTTRTINTWQVGMLARCQTFDMSHGSGTHDGTWNGKNVENKLYWRAVTAIGEAKDKNNYDLDNHILDDGLKHNYIDLANYTDEDDVQLYLANSDNPEAYDNIVCFGDWKDRSLSNLIMIETVGSDAPSIKELLGVGYTDGTYIDWNPDNKVRTQISPVAGNKFVAPEFIIEATNEHLRNENRKGVAVGFIEANILKTTGSVGDILLENYSSWPATGAKIRVCTSASYTEDVGGLIQVHNAVYETQSVNRGNGYVLESSSNVSGNGHLFVATDSGWQDKGLVNEGKSSLKVDINGITSRVSGAEGNISQLQQTAAGLVSMVSQNTLNRNILNGVLTGTGWKSGVWDNGTFTPSGDISVDNDGWFVKNAEEDNCFALEGISLAAESYMLSVYSAAVSETGTLSVDYPSISCYLKKTSDTISITTNSGVERRECTTSIQITQALSGNYTLYIVSPKIRFPQLEKGTSVTDFDAPVLEQTTSIVSQMADSISASITNKLGETGININGNNRSIELRGDMVTFTNSDGSVSGMVTIDPVTGALHATDAVFTGITATNAIITGVLTSEDEESMNKIVINSQTGGIISYGSSHLDYDDNGGYTPSEGSTYGKTFELGWGADPDTLSRYGFISLHNAADNNPAHGVYIDDKIVSIGDSLMLSAGGMTSGGAGGKEWFEIVQSRLRVARPTGSSYSATLNDVMIILTGNNVQSGFTITLPNPATAQGKFYFIKNKKGGNAYVTCQISNSIMNDDSTSTSTTENIGDNSTLFFCDGEHWILMQLDY